MALVPLRSTYGVVAIRDGEVTGFREKPVLEGYWLNAGIYLMSREVLAMLPDKGDLSKDVFPMLASKGLLGCSTFTGKYWTSIDSIKDLEEAEKDLKLGSHGNAPQQ
jgi:NDP-sugar pyrophosphorylase family protein